MSKCETLVATPQLRLLRKEVQVSPLVVSFTETLQQYWTDPLNASGKGEWRDVPTVHLYPTYEIPSKPLTETPIIHCDGD